MDTLDFVMRLEQDPGGMSLREHVEGFGRLVRTGDAWTLQGSYGRQAKHLIELGYLDPDGTVNEHRLCSGRLHL